MRTFPLLKTLNDDPSTDSIHYLTLSHYKDVLEMSPWIDTVFSYDRDEFLSIFKATNRSLDEKIGVIQSFFERVREHGYEVVYDLHNSRESMILATVLSDYKPDRIRGNHLDERGGPRPSIEDMAILRYNEE